MESIDVSKLSENSKGRAVIRFAYTFGGINGVVDAFRQQLESVVSARMDVTKRIKIESSPDRTITGAEITVESDLQNIMKILVGMIAEVMVITISKEFDIQSASDEK
jgi:hypothetical protein